MRRRTILAVVLVCTIGLSILAYLGVAYLWWTNPPTQLKNIIVDCSVVMGRIRSLQGMNCGPLAARSAYNFSKQYIELGVDYVRIHDFYGPGDIDTIFPAFDADPTLPSNYDFSKTDFFIQGIKAIDAEIVFRLGYSWGKPHASVSYIESSDHDKWAEICKHIVMHYNDGWANGFQYNITYWEIWNEPDIQEFWTGTPREYYELYEVTAQTLKTYDSTLKVGGPAVANDFSFAEGFVGFCRDRDIPLDFFSWHIYQPMGIPHIPYNVCLRATQVQELLYAYEFYSTESLLTEWNIDPGGYDSGTVKGAAYTASFLIYMQDTNIAIANRYRGDAHLVGLFTPTGAVQKPYYSFEAFKTLFETPNRLNCTGSDKSGYAVWSGKSDDDRVVSVIISDFNSGYDGYKLEINNLPWGDKPFRCERYVLDEFLIFSRNLELVETTKHSGAGGFLTIHKMVPPSVQLLILTIDE